MQQLKSKALYYSSSSAPQMKQIITAVTANKTIAKATSSLIPITRKTHIIDLKCFHLLYR